MYPIKFSFLCWASLTSRTQRGGLPAHCIPRHPCIPTCCQAPPSPTTPAGSHCYHKEGIEADLSSELWAPLPVPSLASSLGGQQLWPSAGTTGVTGAPSALAENRMGLADGSRGLSLDGPHQTQTSPLHRGRNRGPSGRPPAQVTEAVRHMDLGLEPEVFQLAGAERFAETIAPIGAAQLVLRGHLESVPGMQQVLQAGPLHCDPNPSITPSTDQFHSPPAL